MAKVALIKIKLLRLIPEGVVFLGGFTMMAYEILAARVVAPYLGSSLYTWTSVIASVLFGIIIGSRIGGLIADKNPSMKTLGWLCSMSGIGAILAFLAAPIFGGWLSQSDLPLGALSLFFCLLIFFPPACLSAMLTPAAIRIQLASLNKTGSVYGFLGAWNAAGSILGTYATGFLFQAYIGTSITWYALSFLMIFIGGCLLLRKKQV